MMLDLVQENNRLEEENKALKEKIIKINEKKIGFNEDFNYKNLLELHDLVYRMLGDASYIKEKDDRTEVFVEELANMEEACETFEQRVLDW